MAAMNPGRRRDIVTLSSETPGAEGQAGIVGRQIWNHRQRWHFTAAEGSHCRGAQAAAANKVGQKAEQDLRTGGARQGSRGSVGVREK